MSKKTVYDSVMGCETSKHISGVRYKSSQLTQDLHCFRHISPNSEFNWTVQQSCFPIYYRCVCHRSSSYSVGVIATAVLTAAVVSGNLRSMFRSYYSLFFFVVSSNMVRRAAAEEYHRFLLGYLHTSVTLLLNLETKASHSIVQITGVICYHDPMTLSSPRAILRELSK
jgi:hypothetical protein